MATEGTPAMHLYGVTLQKASAITQAISGSFSAPKAKEIVVARGKVLELYRTDADGDIHSVLSWECFGIIRSVLPFRLIAGKRDYIVVGSDSGKIVVLQFDGKSNRFVKVHEETFGKSGCRRIVPGQYLCADPRGRAVMIGAMEKQKFVYVLNRDASNNLTISSPLQAHKSHTLVLSMVGVDNGFENPQFACLEVDYNETRWEGSGDAKTASMASPTKNLTYYELDLGLNVVKREWSSPTDPNANMLIAVPGGEDGPGGVLVCAENYMIYKNIDHDDVKVPLPRRAGLDEKKGVIVVSSATVRYSQLFFFLVQTECGDLLRVTLTYDEDVVEDIAINYFDTIPVATSLCVLLSGYLFAASEYGDHYLFKIQGGINDGDEATRTTRADLGKPWRTFKPRRIRNLARPTVIGSLAPVMDSRVEDLVGEGSPQVYTLCGRGSRSSLRVLRYGLPVSEEGEQSLPGTTLTRVWAVRKRTSDTTDRYILVSTADASIILEMIDGNLTNSTETKLETKGPTLSFSLLADSSLLQVLPGGLHRVSADGKSVSKWNAPNGAKISKCAVNARQVVFTLDQGNQLVYFELDGAGQLQELTRKSLSDSQVTSLAIAPIADGQRRSLFMAVGGADNVVRVLSLDPKNTLSQLTLQAVAAPPSSLAFARMSADEAKGIKQDLYLYCGLQNGVLNRSGVDPTNGGLSDSRKRFLGTRPVKLRTVQIEGRTAVLALSSRSWLSYGYQGRFQMTPLSFDALADAATLSVDGLSDRMLVGIAGDTMRFVSITELGKLYNTTKLALRYTPRRMAVHPETKHLIIIESDQQTVTLKEKNEIIRREKAEAAAASEPPTKRRKTAQGESDSKEDAKEGDDQDDDEPLPFAEMTEAVRGAPGKWASCIRIVNPRTLESDTIIELEDNEAAFSVATVRFSEKDDKNVYLAVGTVRNLRLAPRKHSGGYIHLYRFVKRGDSMQLEFVHKTPVNDVTLAMTEFDKKLLCGVGRYLRIYDLGTKKLLRKCENKNFPTTICSLDVKGNRVYVGDMCESFFMVRYKKDVKQFFIFADTSAPFYVTSRCLLDYNTIAGGDKFGNLIVARLPSTVTKEKEEDPIGLQGKFGMGKLNSAANKLETIVNYYVGESIASLQQTELVPAGPKVIFYTTIMGAIGMFVPFRSRDDLEFFSHLEMHLRQENAPLCGRDHLAFRSYYSPVKECIDGDLCEQYATLPYGKQKSIADELASSPAEVIRKLEEMRFRVL